MLYLMLDHLKLFRKSAFYISIMVFNYSIMADAIHFGGALLTVLPYCLIPWWVCQLNFNVKYNSISLLFLLSSSIISELLIIIG